jgi:hypothetical protein
MPEITLPGGIVLKDVPRSAIAFVAILLAASVVFLGYWTTVRKPELELVSAREATEAAMLEIEEFGKHIGEKSVSEYTLSESPLMLARLYKDRCILLVSETPEGVRSKLVRDMARDAHKAKKSATLFSLPVLSAFSATRCDGLQHPGPFDTKYGPKQGCWVPVWRIWRDGCTQVQMYDACHGTWDAAVKWTTCNH